MKESNGRLVDDQHKWEEKDKYMNTDKREKTKERNWSKESENEN